MGEDQAALGSIGGHALAGLLGGMLNGMGARYWEIVQGVTLVYAIIGMLAGILVRLSLIRALQARGGLDNVERFEDLPKAWLTGVEPEPRKQEIAGREPLVPTYIYVLAFTLALIVAGSGLALVIRRLAAHSGIPVISVIPIWGYAVLTTWVIWLIMVKLRLSWTVDNDIKSKIVSMLTDFAIVAAIVSMPVARVLDYILPIVIISVFAMLGTIAFLLLPAAKLFTDHPFERPMLIFGTCSGVFIPGLMLLKICDPKLQSTTLRDGSLAYSVSIIGTFVAVPFAVQLGYTHGPIGVAVVGLIMTAAAIIGLVLTTKLIKSAPMVGEHA